MLRLCLVTPAKAGIQFYYVLSSKKNGTLYIGVTNDLIRRVYEHKEGFVEGFTQKYDIKNLVYFEECPSIETAIIREKQLKKWNREWKVRLIESINKEWEDLYYTLTG